MKKYQAWVTSKSSSEQVTTQVQANNKREALEKFKKLDQAVKLKDIYIYKA